MLGFNKHDLIGLKNLLPDFMLKSILQDLELKKEVSLMLSEEPIFLEKFLEVYLGIKLRNILKHIMSCLGKIRF